MRGQRPRLQRKAGAAAMTREPRGLPDEAPPRANRLRGDQGRFNSLVDARIA